MKLDVFHGFITNKTNIKKELTDSISIINYLSDNKVGLLLQP